MSAGKKRGWNANLPVWWLTDPVHMTLSDAATATHHRALMFGVQQENDGAIDKKALRLIVSPDADVSEVTAELVEAGLWDVTDTGFQVVEWEESQTTAATARKIRAGAAKRQREYMKRQAGIFADGVNDGVNDASVTRPLQIRPDQTSTDQISNEENEVVTPNWKSKMIPNGTCSVCGHPFTSPDPERFTVCPVQDDAHAQARRVVA